MKARYYDPAMGRFVSPDRFVSNSYNPQNLNRYAYCDNNPVNFTDPTGNWKLNNFLKSTVQAVTVAAMVAVTIYCPATAVYWGAAIGAAGGAANAGLSGGSWNQAFQAAAIGGASGMVAGYAGGSVGGAVGTSFGGFAGAVAGGGAAGAAGGASAAALTPGSNRGNIWMATYRGAAYGGATGAALWAGGQAVNYFNSRSYRPGEGLLAEGGQGDYHSKAEEYAANAGKFVRDYGSVDLTFNAGNGVLGVNGNLSVTSEGLTGTVGIGWGILGGVSVTGNGNIGQSVGWGASFSYSGGYVGGAGATGILGFGGGNSFSSGLGFGLGAGASVTVGYTGQILKW